MAEEVFEDDAEYVDGHMLVVDDRYWQPHAVHVKLNCGSVWYKPSCKVALCVIARAPDREVLFAECEIGVATSVPDGEAKACLLALRLASERLGDPFVIESDFFHAGFSTFEAFGALLPPSVALLISQYQQQQNVEWIKCERRQNRAALEIGRRALDEKLDRRWRQQLLIRYGD